MDVQARMNEAALKGDKDSLMEIWAECKERVACLNCASIKLEFQEFVNEVPLFKCLECSYIAGSYDPIRFAEEIKEKREANKLAKRQRLRERVRLERERQQREPNLEPEEPGPIWHPDSRRSLRRPVPSTMPMDMEGVDEEEVKQFVIRVLGKLGIQVYCELTLSNPDLYSWDFYEAIKVQFTGDVDHPTGKVNRVYYFPQGSSRLGLKKGVRWMVMLIQRPSSAFREEVLEKEWKTASYRMEMHGDASGNGQVGPRQGHTSPTSIW